MATTKDDVVAFLSRLKSKASLFQIVYLDSRPKNVQTLAKLEITPKDRDDVIQQLTVSDYSQGPLEEVNYGGDAEMYVFGKTINHQEVYIKVTLGRPQNAVICISFHIAEHPMTYPFKRSEA